MRTKLILALGLALLPACAKSTESKPVEVVTETVEYKHGDVVLSGYLAMPGDVDGQVPGVLVVHAWKGIGPHERESAEELARMGYVAFCADIYGKGIRPTTREGAAEQATKYRSDRALMRARANAGLAWLKAHESVDPARTAAIGYCFGGGTVLELARSGADFLAAVSFHGNLDTPDPADAENIKARVLVLHGAADPHVPPEQVAAFETEMKDAGVDYELVPYEGAVHSFTHKDAGNDPSKGAAYDAKAAEDSWKRMQALFEEVF
jgi:dienelactone hydrolase